MRVLILSCNTGGGHNSCAKSIQEAFHAQGIDCTIDDGLRFVSPFVSRSVCNWHVRIYRHASGLFRRGYRYVDKHPSLFQETSLIYKLLSMGSKRLYRLIDEQGYDTVICTHVFPAMILTEVMRKYPVKLSTAHVTTDYTCSPSTEDSKLDLYFIPHRSLEGEFVRAGIPNERLRASGIPIRQAFLTPGSKPQARRSLQLPEDCRHMVMMCGSMGCGPIDTLSQCICASLTQDDYLTIVCGTNHKLCQKLSHRFAENPHVRVCGYVDEIALLMDSADLYITKPGGISVTEAAAKRLPMVFIDAVGSYEERNKIYFVSGGAAMTADTVPALARLCLSLLSDPEKRQAMAEAYQQICPLNAAEVISSTLLMQNDKSPDN